MTDQAHAKKSMGLRLTMVFSLTLLLLLPTFLIMALVSDRQATQAEAISEVGGKWGGAQVITGPIISVPYRVQTTDDKGLVRQTTEYAYFLPELLNIEGDLQAEMRQRGIYEITAYGSKLKLSGQFKAPDFSTLSIAGANILWQDSFVILGVTDLKGIQENVNLNWNDSSFQFNPGLEQKTLVNSGLSVKAPVNNATQYSFNLDLSLNGTRELSFVPVGKETKVKLSSDWPSPSFSGSFLPENYDLQDNGFSANWQVLSLNRNFPQSFVGDNTQEMSDSAFGVNFFIPVDEYQKSMRTVKYAILLIGLTFLTFFFVEVFNKRRIHPIQYLLAGVALCVFYLLLLSISEYLNFDLAYLIAGVATIALITIYCLHILKNYKLTILQALILLLLYTFVYIIIQLEDFALLMGSIGIFIILAIVMFISKKIDWYGEKSEG